MCKVKILIWLLFFLPYLAFAQDYSARWEDLYAYNQIQDISFDGQKIYAAAENAVFTYGLTDTQTEKISSVHGLSGQLISEIHFSKAEDVLIIGYKNGLLEFVRQGKDIFSVIGIRDKQTLTPAEKQINHIYEQNGILYVSANYGITQYDLKKQEFGETFFIGDNGEKLKVFQTTIANGYIYAATSQGLKRAKTDNPLLIDYQQWEKVDNAVWQAVVAWQNIIYGVSNGVLKKIDGNKIHPIFTFNEPYKDLRVSEQGLVLTTSLIARVFEPSSSGLDEIVYKENRWTGSLICAYYVKDQLFLGHSSRGLLQFAPSWSSKANFLSPEGPLMNQIYDMTAVPNELWVVFGGYDINFNPYPLETFGISHLQDGSWHSFNYDELQNAKVLVDIAVNPNNTDQVFVSSYFSGLLQFDAGEFVGLYTNLNSNLEATSLNPSTNDVRVGGIAFDSEGNLFMTNSLVNAPLKKWTPDAGITAIDISEAFLEPLSNGTGELIVDDFGHVFFGTNKSGIMAYQPSTGTARTIASNIDGVDLPEDYSANPTISALALDQNGQLWIGTEHGLRVMYNTANIFQDNPEFQVKPIVFLENGVPQELLYGQFITDVAVDGNNKKWIATTDAGVFYVSENGQKTIYHFSTENSPLPTNTVNSVEIDQVSGKVYLGTENGLLVFRGGAVRSEDSLDEVYVYPNPVRPNYSGMVMITKLMAGANVKITDISGNLVYETVSEGGSVQWDTRSFNGQKVASGVYLALITGEKALKTTVVKIMIIR